MVYIRWNFHRGAQKYFLPAGLIGLYSNFDAINDTQQHQQLEIYLIQ